jgi:hypothetical protein
MQKPVLGWISVDSYYMSMTGGGGGGWMTGHDCLDYERHRL